MRPSRRQVDELRPVSLERGVVKYAEGSCFVKFGDTHVLVTASLEERLPPWLKGQGRGWVTAEYGMLPRATSERTRREASAGKQGGRTVEIQRLIGRSLRSVVDLQALGERQITIDCDVIQADGGTRTASITGAWVALADCLAWMKTRDMFKDGDPMRDHIAAVSCGVYKNTAVLDLDYAEDFGSRHRRQFRHERQRQHRRDPGHRREDAVQRGAVPRAARAGAQGHRQAGRPAEDGGGVSVTHRQLTGPVVIATHNPGKLREMRELLAPYGIEAQSAGELGLGEPEETGTTFAANAHIKAMAAAKATGHVAFADDFGLVVEALGGEPGIHSARWAGEGKDFRGAMNRIQTLLDRTRRTRARSSAARISSPRCVSPGPTATRKNSKAASTVSWSGRRAATPASVTIRCFCPDGFNRTFGEMTADEKHGLAAER